MSDLNDILAGGKGNIPEEKLIAYLEGKLPAEEQHEVELWLADNGMESDALEGLKELSVTETKNIVTQLNHNLHTTLHKKHKRKGKLANNNQLWMAVIIVLMLCIAAYLVIHYATGK